jgi:malate dehydrogenase (oxaloacetate-decarboxylating)
MLAAAGDALAATSPALADSPEPLLPPLGSVREVSALVAAAVVAAAEREGLARAPADGDPLERVRAAMWQPCYAPLRPAAR